MNVIRGFSSIIPYNNNSYFWGPKFLYTSSVQHQIQTTSSVIRSKTLSTYQSAVVTATVTSTSTTPSTLLTSDNILMQVLPKEIPIIPEIDVER